jgi:hypothetical protein
VTAIALSAVVKATLRPLFVGKVAGLENLVPNPEPLQGYAVTNGVLWCATAIALLAVLKDTPSLVPVGTVAGSENFVPKPELDQG